MPQGHSFGRKDPANRCASGFAPTIGCVRYPTASYLLATLTVHERRMMLVHKVAEGSSIVGSALGQSLVVERPWRDQRRTAQRALAPRRFRRSVRTDQG